MSLLIAWIAAALFTLGARAQQIESLTSGYVEVLCDRDGSFYTVDSTPQAGLPTTPHAIQSQHGGGTCVAPVRPSQSAPCTDLYIRKLAADGRSVIAATYFGGDRPESVPKIALAPDGSLIVSFLSESSSVAGGLDSTFANRGVLMRLSANLDRVEAIRRLPQNSGLRAIALSSSELFVAGTEFYEPNRNKIFLEAINPQTLGLNRSFEYESSAGLQISRILWRPSGDLILAWSAQLDGSRVAAIDPYSGQMKWNTQLAPSIEIKALGLLPGNGIATFSNGFTPTAAPQSFIQRLNSEGAIIEPPLIVGSRINYARTTSDGLLEWTGSSVSRGSLLSSPNAPYRCRPAAPSLYYARMHFSQGQPDFVSYLSPEGQRALFPAGELDGFPLIRNGSNLLPLAMPVPLANPTPGCLEAETENYVLSSGRSRSPSFELAGGRSVTPGEFLTIYGAGISEGEAIFPPEITGSLPTEIAGTRILVDGHPAGIIEIKPTRITIALPYEVAAREKTIIAMERDGVLATPIELNVIPHKLFVFSEPIERVGFAGVYKNGLLVTEQNPLRPGDEVAVYINGAGALSELFDAGAILTSERLPQPLAEIRAFIDGSGGQAVTFAGGVRGQLPGLLQVNVRIAEDLRYEGRLTLRLMIGSDSAATDFWIRQP